MTMELSRRLQELVPPSQKEYKQADLRSVWESLGLQLDEGAFLMFEDAFLESVDPEISETLRFRPGGWIVRASSSTVKSGITAALLTVALAAGHVTGIPLLVIPAVIPMLVEIEKVRLTNSERAVLLELNLTSAAKEKTAAELYESLPDHIKDEVSQLAFGDFLERFRQGGFLDEIKDTSERQGQEKYILRSPGSERFRITIV